LALARRAAPELRRPSAIAEAHARLKHDGDTIKREELTTKAPQPVLVLRATKVSSFRAFTGIHQCPRYLQGECPRRFLNPKPRFSRERYVCVGALGQLPITASSVLGSSSEMRSQVFRPYRTSVRGVGSDCTCSTGPTPKPRLCRRNSRPPVTPSGGRILSIQALRKGIACQ
jgi:hypothetical protein